MHCVSGEKKKTKAVNNDLNPVWNEVSNGLELTVSCESYSVDREINHLRAAITSVKTTCSSL